MIENFFSRQVFRARIFRREVARAAAGDLAVICGGCEHCAADYRIDRRGFPYACLEFVVAGRGRVIVDGAKQWPLEPGTIFTYGPRTRYRMESDAARPLTKYFIDFTGRRALPLLRQAGFPPGSTAQVFPPAAMAEAFDRVIDAGLDTASHAARRAALLLEAVLLNCADHRVPDGAAESRAFATYQRCRDVIEGLDPAGPIIRSLAATATACHLDSAYLCRLFRRFAGASPYHYLVRRRMEAATARLAYPGSLVKEVAAEFGFADPYHFSRAFKRFHGLAPARFLIQRRDKRPSSRTG